MQPTRDKALYFLMRREHSRFELQQKLLLRGFELPVIIEVLNHLENENLLNEDRYVANFIRSRARRGIGPLKICAQLQNHGIDHHRIYANEEMRETLWQENAIATRIKRFGETIPQERQQQLQQARFLQQRGFTQQQIRLALTSGLNID